MDSLLIREATLDDVASINRIYNEAIETTSATFDTRKKSVGQQEQWFRAHGERFPVMIAESNAQVVGWCSLSQWSPKPAYAITAETTCYVAEGFRGQGIGRRLKEAIIERARLLGFHSLIARVVAESSASIELNQSLGFKKIGTMKEAGCKFGRLLDVHIFQLIVAGRLDSNDDTNDDSCQEDSNLGDAGG